MASPTCNYDDWAQEYAETRWAFPWVLHALARTISRLNDEGCVVEIGCGTGNYSIALAPQFVSHVFYGFDLSQGMIDIALSRPSRVTFHQANAEGRFPYSDAFADLAFLVDVIHHLVDYERFFNEAYRVLRPSAALVIVTVCEDNLEARSLTHFFPEILEVELSRYPTLETLSEIARDAGFTLEGRELVEGTIPLSDEFLAKVEMKCASSMRLISEAAHQRGLERLRTAQERGLEWVSSSTVFTWIKSLPPAFDPKEP